MVSLRARSTPHGSIDCGAVFDKFTLVEFHLESMKKFKGTTFILEDLTYL